MNGAGAGMFDKAWDRIAGRLGLPNTWERRTKAAVMEAHGFVTNPRGQPQLVAASAWRFEPAAMHMPTGWTVAFPRKPSERRLGWGEFSDGRLVLQAGALRQGVWLETRIFEPGPSSLVEVFEAQLASIQERLDGVEDLVLSRPSEDGATAGELSLAFRRNGAPQRARMLTLGVKGYVVEVFYDTPARLSETAWALADDAVAIGLESASLNGKRPELDPEQLAAELRAIGLSEDEIAEALQDCDSQRT